MTGEPAISVVLPVHNGAAWLAEALGSIRAQTLAPAEVIAIDDGSTDDSAAVLAGFPGVRVLSQPNAGVTVARNRGIAAASGALIAFLDQDDRWRPDALRVAAEAHAADPALAYTLAHQVCFLAEGEAVPPWFGRQSLDRPHVGYLPGTLVARRAAFETLGPFDPAYPISSDADWFARAKDAGLPMAVLADVVLERRIHAANQSRFARTIQAELMQLLKRSVDRKAARKAGGTP